MRYLLTRFKPFFALFFSFAVLGFLYKTFSCEAVLDKDVLAWSLMFLNFFIQIFIVFNYEMLIYGIYLFILPKKFHLSLFDSIASSFIYFVFAFIIVFSKMSEGLFWNEFGVSFNFIAVDYLIYTREVVGNIWQSYPMGVILFVITSISLFFSYLHFRTVKGLKEIGIKIPTFNKKVLSLVVMVAIAFLSYYCYDASFTSIISENKFNQEICKNEAYSFFSAFINNKLNYTDFYITQDPKENFKLLQKEYSGDNVVFTSANSIERFIRNTGLEKRKNVIIVVMESMDSKFMNENRTDGTDATPNLTRLSKEGIYFSNVYSTGTRTVRGLEAVTLCLPPQAGMSIVRQKNNGNLLNVGSIFKKKGYSTRWFYGGYGYFDNMNDFFRGNGFEIIDRTDIDKTKIHQATIWGVADEDLYTKVLEENDKNYSPNRPFFEIVLNTSNHRPFDFPKGRIDLEPIKSGRIGAVKYADWAIGDFIKRAKEKVWFNDTVFVFIADHGSSSAGKRELNPDKHRIPFIIYAPAIFEPQRVDKVISQIDAIPTLLGLLNFSYESRFMGRDVFTAPDDGRYFISNYQYIGYGEANKFVVLKPVREAVTYVDGVKQKSNDSEMIKKAVAFYQYSSDWKKRLSDKNVN